MECPKHETLLLQLQQNNEKLNELLENKKALCDPKEGLLVTYGKDISGLKIWRTILASILSGVGGLVAMITGYLVYKGING